MFECLGDCADFDLVNGCVAGDQAEAARASLQRQGQGQARQHQQQPGAAEDEEYSEGDGSEDGSQQSYSDVSIFSGVEERTIRRWEGARVRVSGAQKRAFGRRRVREEI